MLFVLFGPWLLFDGALSWTWVAVAVTSMAGGAALAAAIIGCVRYRRTRPA